MLTNVVFFAFLLLLFQISKHRDYLFYTECQVKNEFTNQKPNKIKKNMVWTREGNH